MQLNLNDSNPFEKARNAFKSSSPISKTFEEHKADFENSSLGRQVEKAFKPLPYEVENKGLYRMAGVLSYACQIISITAAASFVFAFIFSRINVFSGAWYVAFVLAGAALFCLEYLLRRETEPVTRQILLRQFSSKLWRRVAFVLVLTSIGVTSSYFGGFDTAKAIATDKPAYTAPALLAAPVIDLQEIRERYKPQIEDAKQAAKEYKKKRLWNNRLSIADGNKYRKLLAVVTAKESDLNNEIKAATATNTEQRQKTIDENNRRETSAKADHNGLITAFDNRVNNNGGGLAYLSVLCQFIFFCGLFYRSHYLIETAKQYSSPTSEDETPTGNDPSGGGSGKRKTINNLSDADIESLLHQFQNGANDSYLNAGKPSAKMRVLRNDKDVQSYLSNDTNGKPQTIYKDIEVEHFSEQKQQVQMVNLAAVKRNKSAWRSHLKKAIETNKPESRIQDLKDKIDYWQGLEEQIYLLSMEREKAAV